MLQMREGGSTVVQIYYKFYKKYSRILVPAVKNRFRTRQILGQCDLM
jgi:hypothetical protein